MRRLAGPLAAIAVVVLSICRLAAAPPPEATNLGWCAGPAKDCLTWISLGAVQHRIYEGDRSTLPSLLNGSVDSCLVRIWNNASTTGPGQITDLPAAGDFYWYLVVGKNCEGEGSSGNATAGARVRDSSGDCNPASCFDGMHNGAEAGVDCGGGCAGCPNGQLCCVAIDCASTVCVAGVCAAPSCGDFVKNGTETDVDCGGGACPPCANGLQCLVDSDCQSLVCAFGFCQAATCNDSVQNGTETDVDCGGGTCPACANGLTCNVAADCVSGLCQAGVCTALGTGTNCTSSPQCASGNCVDGVCCNTACNFLCQSCIITFGTCENIPAGQDPDNECAGAATCNGSGACSSPVGSPCSFNAECQSGNCVDGVCCNTACTGVCQACNNPGSVGTCGNIPAGTDPANECAGTLSCNGSGACQSSVGAPCTLNAQCGSGNCVDGVCCNTACTGLCQACNLVGTIGTCSFIPSGQDPAGECAGIAVCNGSGGCFEP